MVLKGKAGITFTCGNTSLILNSTGTIMTSHFLYGGTKYPNSKAFYLLMVHSTALD
jgi:hypothetical protein